MKAEMGASPTSEPAPSLYRVKTGDESAVDASCVETGMTLLRSKEEAPLNGTSSSLQVYDPYFCDVIDLKKLYRKYRRVKSGKRDRIAAIRFSLSPFEGLCMLKWSLEYRYYLMGLYTAFKVFRPAERDVKSCAFQDKIVLSSFSDNMLWPVIDKHLINANYASRAGLGPRAALDDLRRNLRRYYINHGSSGWVYKLDARKYFFNLQHEHIVNSLIKIGCPESGIWLTKVILESSWAVNERGERVGAPIGNVTSQAYAVHYLNPIDHYVKDQRGLKYYGRYMDDSYIVHPDRAYLEQLDAVLHQKYMELGLELNHKTQIQPLKNGVKFLGMHMYLTDTGAVQCRVSPTNIKYQRVHLRENAEKVADGVMTEESYWKRFEAWDNHASYADSKKLRKKMYHYAKEALKNALDRKRRKLGAEPTDIAACAGSSC